MESTETRIKEIIIDRYGSVKKFCETIGMPWTTLDSILKRGIANSNITNVMKITKELKVDTESLASGIILNSVGTKINKAGTMESPKIMQYYEMLNDIGKHEATKRVEELTLVPRYVKEDTNYVNAAHSIEGASEEDKQHDEEIMNDENF